MPPRDLLLPDVFFLILLLLALANTFSLFLETLLIIVFVNLY